MLTSGLFIPPDPTAKIAIEFPDVFCSVRDDPAESGSVPPGETKRPDKPYIFIVFRKPQQDAPAGNDRLDIHRLLAVFCAHDQEFFGLS